MAKKNIVLPAMGEGVIEATINKWLVKENTKVDEDDPLVEVATDKVDSEIPAPQEGKIVSIVAKEGTIAKVGEVLAILEIEGEETSEESEQVKKEVERIQESIKELKLEQNTQETAADKIKSRTPSGKFLSPLVRNIADKEGISYDRLDKISGTGLDGRITKNDILKIVNNKSSVTQDTSEVIKSSVQPTPVPQKVAAGDEVIPMDKVRKIISEHMVMSKRTSAHVTSFIDADVTAIVNWREANKNTFLAKEGQKLTLTPIFVDATARALNELPMLNISVEGTNIIKKKNINIGIAVAQPNGNLIVPVIKKAHEKSLTGLALSVNDLANRARNNKLQPEEITGGTFTITNFGSYHNLFGTPIINQPQVAILGTGVVRKTPVVVETKDGDMIGIRQIMILSLSYDHRVIDGALAGKFLHKIKEILENYVPKIS